MAALLFSVFSPTTLAKYDPSLNWYTFETKHFAFHYSDGLEEVTREMAGYAETIHLDLSEKFHWVPRHKTHIVLSDQTDLANGNATPLPNNQIVIYLAPPNDVSSLEDFDNWKHLVLKHEYVHILHADKAQDLPLHMRSILGRHWLFFPNTFLPRWISEGLATYYETDTFKGIGRGQSTYYRALMQNELRHGFKSLDQLNANTIDWPGGISWYLYGVYFFNFLSDTYGEKTLQAFVESYSEYPIPLFVNSNFKKILNKSLYELWDEFQLYLSQKFAPADSVAVEAIGVDQRLSHSGYYSGFSQMWGENQILFIASDRLESKKLILYDLSTQQQKVVLSLTGQDNVFGQSFDVHPQQGIIIPILDKVRNTEILFDLYKVNVSNGDKTRLTIGGRYSRAAWMPDGQRIIALKNEKTIHRLEMLDMSGHLIKTLWQGESDMLIGSMAISPDGKQLAVSAFKPNEGWNLHLIKLDNETHWQQLTHTNFIETYPSFTGNSTLLFSADYSGNYQLYQLDLSNNSLMQLSQEDTVHFFPELSQDGRYLFYAKLGKNGFDLYQKTFDVKGLASSFPQDFQSLPDISSQAILSADIEKHSRAYHGLDYLSPPWFFPLLTTSESQESIGFTTATSDPLEWHNYILKFAINLKDDEGLWDLTYNYSRWYADILLTSRQDLTYFESTSSRLLERKHDYGIAAILPYSRLNFTLKGVLSWQHINNKLFRTLDKNIDVELKTKLAESNEELLLGGLSFENTQSSTWAVQKNSGVALNAYFENNAVHSDNFKQHSRINVVADFFSPQILRSVFRSKFTMVAAGSEAGKLTLAGSGSELSDTRIFGKRNYILYGYRFPLEKSKETNLHKFDMSLRIPLWFPYSSRMTPAFGLKRIYIQPFFQAARIGSYSTVNTNPVYRTLGFETTAKLDFAFGRFPLDLTIGLARGLDTYGENQGYLKFGLDL